MKVPIRRALVLWLILTVMGALIVALVPDQLFGTRILFRLSDQHGPTISESVGVFVIIAGWIYYLFELWLRRNILSLHPTTKWIMLGVLVSVCGCLLAGVRNLNIIMAVSATIALAAQIYLGLLAAKLEGP